MEPVGLVFGAAGFCVEAVEKIDSYRDFQRDSRTLNARFESEKLRFQEWGRKVGIERGSLEDSSSQHPALDDPNRYTVVKELVSLLQDTCEVEGDDQSSSRRRKMAWALRNKKRRTDQVNAFTESVRSLHDLVPIEAVPMAAPEHVLRQNGLSHE